MKLFLMRHGEAKSSHEDHIRPLSDKGIQAIRHLAGLLKAGAGLPVAEIRHSGKRRAEQTATLVREVLALDVPLTRVDYLDPLDDVSSAANQVQSFDADLLLVGHLPHLNKLASVLLCGDQYGEAFSFHPGTLLCLQRVSLPGIGADPQRFHWSVEWMMSPTLFGVGEGES
ncbi:MAG: phosphohistidine phosphatase SixA [Myxococcales bacterium]|nr:phosphohistidine phosphatase SixA [Myxococcales bacterium]